jgi:hypothetical protein
VAISSGGRGDRLRRSNEHAAFSEAKERCPTLSTKRTGPQALTGELPEESVNLVRLRRDLAGLQDIAAFIAERDRDWPCVLVDAQVQQGWFC